MSENEEALARRIKMNLRINIEELRLHAPSMLIDDDEVFPQRSFTCPKCGRTSYNPDDVKNEYCGHCHLFTVDSH